jgi:hypothetical protein
MFFEMFQPRIDNLLDVKHLAAKQVCDIVDMPFVSVNRVSIAQAKSFSR